MQQVPLVDLTPWLDGTDPGSASASYTVTLWPSSAR